MPNTIMSKGGEIKKEKEVRERVAGGAGGVIDPQPAICEDCGHFQEEHRDMWKGCVHRNIRAEAVSQENWGHVCTCRQFNPVPPIPDGWTVPEVWEAKSGAVRSERCLRYDLIPAGPLRRLAQRYTEGAVKYGEWNWQKGVGDKEWKAQVYCHLQEHLMRWTEEGRGPGREGDDNLAAAAWGCFALMWLEDEERRAESADGVDGDGILTPRQSPW